MGSLIAWGVNLNIIGNYSTSTSNYTLNTISANAYIDPKQPPTTGDGKLEASISETIDYGNKVTRQISPAPSSFWYSVSEVWSKSAYVYFSKYGDPKKTFYYSAEEVGNYTFSHPSGIIHNPNWSLTLSISGPK